jgi:AcrR family transcriptional regulator
MDPADGAAKQKPSIWERIEQRASGLNHERIAEAAVRIADEDGLEGLSMRRLGDALGAATMALYRHVGSKEDVLGLMLNLVYGEIDLPSGEAGWREVMSRLAWELRTLHLRHPWAGQVQSITASGFAPNVLLVNECALSALDGLGMDAESMMTAFATVMAFVEGMAAEQISMRNYLRRHGFKSEEDFLQAYQDSFAPYVRWIYSRADRYPTVIRLMASGYTEDYERSFGTGLDCVLDGLAVRFKL